MFTLFLKRGMGAGGILSWGGRIKDAREVMHQKSFPIAAFLDSDWGGTQKRCYREQSGRYC